ncbi:hypothetical protein EAH89_13320 [Roseomonas nepalensis]|uniref:Uncharacterized protein n=1 Tax=Muricoccus nepalensis TaxID=1854500 RepID=A0A502G2D5_9PROT|nr:hypothetical protein [Roseomonas nepalensis]TPG55914.1 hypothetical protein EAH89_13320 [Roseomonas nepalensis]
MSTLIERALRSAAEDLGLSNDGWSPIQGFPGTGHAFRHADRPALVVEVSANDHGWGWSVGQTESGPRRRANAGVAQRWACVHKLIVRESPNSRAALLDALAIAGDDLLEARSCSTEMLHTRLDVLVCRKGLELFVAPVQRLDAAPAEPVEPLRLEWSYRGTASVGDAVTGTVQASNEVEAVEAFERLHPGADLAELTPRMAGLAPVLPIARQLAEEGMRRAAALPRAPVLPTLH